jgi:MtfA peptidase
MSVLCWLNDRRRRKLRMQPFPTAWEQILQNNVRVCAPLNEAEQSKLRSDMNVFVAEKNWEGCGGLVVTDEHKITIAAQACLLVLAFENEYFDLVQSILVYPDAYVAPSRSVTREGIVLEGDSAREGEAWYRGPVILSWSDVLAGGRRQSSGHNLVWHEFAHQLDMQNGRQVDGTPKLATVREYERWQQVIGEEFTHLEQDCRHGRRVLLDCYGATDLGEFFAVATECFFGRPRELAHEHPSLYGILRDFYRQDPAVRFYRSDLPPPA